MNRLSSVKNNKGFTLVEVMVAVGLFTVIMTIGIGAIIGVNNTNRKTQTMRAVVDNLSFLMEDMARSMRLGDYFYCDTSIAPPSIIDISDGGNTQLTQDLLDQNSECKSVVFEPYWDSDPGNPQNQVVYFIGEDGNGRGTIYKKDFDNTSFDVGDMLATTSAEIDIDTDRSGFFVIGSSPNDLIQPRVRIVLVGSVRIAGSTTEFNMQTTVSQRFLDVNSLN